MYNRYIPTENGGYRRQIVEDRPKPPSPVVPTEPPAKAIPLPQACQNPAPKPKPPSKPPACSNASLSGLLDGVDKGDLIILLILVLLLMDGETDNGTLLLTVALYFLLQ